MMIYKKLNAYFMQQLKINNYIIIIQNSNQLMQNFGQLVPLNQKNQTYQPAQDQILQYAEYLGFQFPEDQQLLWIAKQGLKADLPQGWIACNTKQGELVYLNLKTKKIVEEHPLDDFYRKKLQQQRKKKLMMQAIERNFQQNELDDITQENQSQLSKSQISKSHIEGDFHKYAKAQPIMNPYQNTLQNKTKNEQNIYKKKNLQQKLKNSQIIDRNFSQNSNSIDQISSQNDSQNFTNEFEKNKLDLEFKNATQINQFNNFSLQDKIIKEDKKERDLQQFAEKQMIRISKGLMTRLKQQFDGIEIKMVNDFKQKQDSENKRLEMDIREMNQKLKQKQKLLAQLKQQRIKKEKQIAEMEIEFQKIKQAQIEKYRTKLKQNLEKQKRMKQDELKKNYEKTKSLIKKKYKHKF